MGVRTLGWQPTPNRRGTWDIIWQCAQTTALCAWVSVCPNAPAPVGGDWDLITDKFFFLLLTLLGPELVFLLAFGQWQNAHASLELFHKSGHKQWTILHAFFADMGGVHVKPLHWKQFPVNSRQLHYLIEKKYMEYPDIKKDEIKALGKTDAVARLITVVQAFVFLVTTLARFPQHLAVTTMELTVLANISCTLATYICWWNKPNNIETSRIYDLKVSMHQIVIEAGPNDHGPYHDNPLDFVSCDQWAPSRCWNYYVNILRRMGLLNMFNLHYPRPAQRINTFNFPKPVARRWAFFLVFVGTSYTAFFIGAWNFQFPTDFERWMWRGVSLAQSSFTLMGGLFETQEFSGPNRHVRSTPTSSADGDAVTSADEKGIGRLRKTWDMPCNNEVTGNHSCFDIPFRSLLISTPLAAMYTLCRWYILIEDFANLRALPDSAFEQIDWTVYLPWL